MKKKDVPWNCKPSVFLIVLLIWGLVLTGCPKKIPGPVVVNQLPPQNPVAQLLNAFSAAESLQAKASIRVEMVKDGEKMNFPLNGFVIYQKPDKLRLLGYHPLGMGLFDALYRSGEFFLLSPLEKKAYTGEILEFEELIEKAGVQISTETPEGSDLPNRITIEVIEKETRVDVRLKDMVVNDPLPEDSFDWTVPEGVDVRPLEQLWKRRKLL